VLRGVTSAGLGKKSYRGKGSANSHPFGKGLDRPARERTVLEGVQKLVGLHLEERRKPMEGESWLFTETAAGGGGVH